MPKGVPKAGFRITKQRLAAGWTPPAGENVLTFPSQKAGVCPVPESEEQVRARIAERFDVLERVANACIQWGGDQGADRVGASGAVFADLSRRRRELIRFLVSVAGLPGSIQPQRTANFHYERC